MKTNKEWKALVTEVAYCIGVLEGGKLQGMVCGPTFSELLILEEIGDEGQVVIKLDLDGTESYPYRWDSYLEQWVAQ